MSLRNRGEVQRAALSYKKQPICGAECVYLLCVVGRVGQHSGHMKHNLIVLVARVEGMRPG